MLRLLAGPMVLLFFFPLVACAGDPDSSDAANGSSARTPRGEQPMDDGVSFQNPTFACPTDSVVEPGEGFPHPVQQYPSVEDANRTVTELRDFCVRMQRRFADPNMTQAEARQVYDLIPQALTITDAIIGMPGPEKESPPPVVLSERVMLRKVGENHYELFYYTTGCGRNYHYYELRVTESGPQAQPIERWTETYPC